MQKYISKILLRFSVFRFTKSFLYGRVKSFLRYFYYVCLCALMIYIPYSITQNKQQITSFKNKIINNYIDFIGNDHDFYNKISITGNRYTDYDDISDIVRNEIGGFSADEDSYLDSVINSIKDRTIKLPWVKNIVIFRNLPSKLNIKIEEYEPFAIWQEGEVQHIIDKDGAIITRLENGDEFSDLLILSGQKANIRAGSLFNILLSDLNISQNIYSATLIGLRRWDIRFNNGLLVKFPEENIKRAWIKLVKIYNSPGSLIDLKSIDLRINDKIYLEYSDQLIKDLKSL